MISKFNEFIKENYKKYNISFGLPPVDFGITHEELDEIMFDITDEFPNIDYILDNSHQSAITRYDENSFVITLYDRNRSFPHADVLYYLEPKIFNIIEDINSKLSIYGLETFAYDFGDTDTTYQIIITKKGNTLKYREDRYEEGGTPLPKKHWK